MERSCLSCRKKADRSELLRFVRAPDGEICFDELGQAASRGVWLCPNKICMTKAADKKLFFRKEKTLELSAHDLRKKVSMSLEKGILSRLGLLRRMGNLEAGKDAVLRFVLTRDVEAVLLAQDLSQNSLAELNYFCDKHDKKALIVPTNFSMDAMGQSLGRTKTGVVALAKGSISAQIRRRVAILSELGH